jgi:hypothetical protein
MSQFTFNIADYRPLSAVRQHRAHDRTPALKGSNGFVVLSSEPRRNHFEWLEPRPSVVDIRSVREGHQITQPLCARRAKVLRFLSHSLDQVYTMPMHPGDLQPDDDSDPTAA